MRVIMFENDEISAQNDSTIFMNFSLFFWIFLSPKSYREYFSDKKSIFILIFWA